MDTGEGGENERVKGCVCMGKGERVVHTVTFTNISCRRGMVAVIAAKPTSEGFNALSPAAHPPPLDLRVRIIVKLNPGLCLVRTLVRVPVRDRLALEFRSHRSTHSVIACALRGSVWQVEDLLVKAGGLLCRRRAR